LSFPGGLGDYKQLLFVKESAILKQVRWPKPTVVFGRGSFIAAPAREQLDGRLMLERDVQEFDEPAPRVLGCRQLDGVFRFYFPLAVLKSATAPLV
jgi:hypothetical protein